MATSENGDVPPGELIKRADRAMLEQKAKSRAASHRHIKDWIEQRHHIAVSLEDIRYAGPSESPSPCMQRCFRDAAGTPPPAARRRTDGCPARKSPEVITCPSVQLPERHMSLSSR